MSRIDQYIHSPEQLEFLLRLFRDPSLPLRKLAFLIDELTSHGLHTPALDAISLATSRVTNEQYLDYLAQKQAVCRFVDQSPIVQQSVADPRCQKFLLGQKAVLYQGLGDKNKLIIVFATLYNNFNISFPFLHGLLHQYGQSILYVKNPDRGMFLTGMAGFGSNIDEMAQSLRALTETRGIEETRVMGLSSGGYASLRIAGLLGAKDYLGFGVTTDMRPDSQLRIGNVARGLRDSAESTADLFDLRQQEEMQLIGNAQLFYGAKDANDRDQAQNMRSLANFSTSEVPDSTHSVILKLIAAGKLQDILNEFAGSSPIYRECPGSGEFEFVH